MEVIYISVAHFEPVPFYISGRGIFPGLVFALDRTNRALRENYKPIYVVIFSDV